MDRIFKATDIERKISKEIKRKIYEEYQCCVAIDCRGEVEKRLRRIIGRSFDSILSKMENHLY
jgi:hypothetical protein